MDRKCTQSKLLFRYWISGLIWVLVINNSIAQVQFANKVVSASSQWSVKYGGSANQILGKPNAFPQKDQSLCVWRPSKFTDNEYIHVSFLNSILPQQVIIGNKSNSNPVFKISFYDSLNSEIQSIQNNAALLNSNNNILTFSLNNLTQKVKSIKVFVKHLGDFSRKVQFDFIALSSSNEPFYPKINVPDSLFFSSKPENLGSNINTKYIELLPVISSDGKKLFFSRRDDPQNIEGPKDDIYCSEYINNEWTLAKNLAKPVNNHTYNYLYAISPNANELLIEDQLETEIRPANGLSIVRKTLDGWGFPEKVIISNFSNKSEFNEFFLTNDGKSLLMSLERNEGYGSNDLYVSFLNPINNIWSTPKNLGNIVNSASPESYPFLASDNKTLYFSSSGFSTYGFSDIFMCKRLDDTWQNWSEPINIGSGINTPGMDQNLVLPANGDYAYFVSDHNSIGKADIFRIKMPSLLKPEPVLLITGKVFNKNNKHGIAAKIEYQDIETGEVLGNILSNPEDGTYKIVLPKGRKYAFHANAKSFLSIEENIDLSKLFGYETLEKDLNLAPIETGQKIILNNLFFESGKYELKNESFVELNNLVSALKANPLLKIKINGFTDNVGKEEDNVKLSKNRAQAVCDYLIQKGIVSGRLKSEGFGSAHQLAPNDTVENKAKNRRVELEILNVK